MRGCEGRVAGTPAAEGGGRTRVKVCGITRVQDGLDAARAGADAIGLVFWPRSSRVVSVDQAAAIVRALPPLVGAVAVFVDPPADSVREVLRRARPTMLQFHGDESPAFCASFATPWLKALRVRDDTDVPAFARRYAGASGLLLDTFRPGAPGGTGQAFDWALVPAVASLPLVLAGGLEPANVGEAIRRVRPWGVDVSGGVESAPGIKDPQRIEAFIREVNRVTTAQRAA